MGAGKETTHLTQNGRIMFTYQYRPLCWIYWFHRSTGYNPAFKWCKMLQVNSDNDGIQILAISKPDITSLNNRRIT